MAIPKTAKTMAEAAGMYLLGAMDNVTFVRSYEQSKSAVEYDQYALYLEFSDGSVYAVSVDKQSTSKDVVAGAE